MTNYRTELITDFEELTRLMPEWDRLGSANPRAAIFGSSGFARAFWQGYGRDRSLCTPVVRNQERVVGILPLAVQGRTLQFLGSPRSDYNDLLCEPDAGPGILEAALSALSERVEWTRCVLRNVPEQSNLLKHLSDAARRQNLSVLVTQESVCPQVDLSTDGEQVLEELLRKKSMKRHCNKLAKLGKVTFRHLSSREEIREHLPTFFQQHVARRALEGEKSLFCHNSARVFYESLVEELDPDRQLRFSVVELDGKPIAYHFGFESEGVLSWYKPAFDVNFWDYSPGEVLLKHLLEYVRDRGLSKLDFTTGNESFKSRFANRFGINYSIHVFRRSRSAAVSRLVLRAKERVKKSKTTAKVARGTLSFVKTKLETVQTMIQCEGLTSLAGKAWRRAWRSSVFAQDEVMVFSAEPGVGLSTDPDLDLREGTLSDLASLAESHRGFFTSHRLAKARQRLKEGDRVYLAWQAGELAHVAWVGDREQITASYEVGSKCLVQLDEPAPVIFDCWTPPRMRGQGIYPRVLKALLAHGASTGHEVWIYCLRNNVASVRGIEKAGFRLRYRMRRTRWLRLLETSHVQEVTSSSAAFSQEVETIGA